MVKWLDGIFDQKAVKENYLQLDYQDFQWEESFQAGYFKC